MDQQKTIVRETTIKGVGLHSGKHVSLAFKPAAVGSGVVFVRTDLAGHPQIKVCVENVHPKTGSQRCSYLEKDGVQVSTVEHLLAALAGLGIDNLLIEIDSDEVCGLDGSSQGFVEALAAAGLATQETERTFCCVKEPIFVEEEGATIVALPCNELKISYTLDYDHPYLTSDFLEVVIDPANFRKDLSPARTFCLEEEVQRLIQSGFGKGANYDTALVVGKNGVIKNKLRFADEFIRHKILDILGDMYILGLPLKAHIVALRSGHSLNLKLVKKISQFQTPKSALGSAKAPALPAGQSLDINQIMQILPHREPFLFVDRILTLEPGKRVVGVKNVTINDYFFRGHFPGKPVMPGVLILEAMAQVGGVMMLVQPENQGKIAYFMSINNAKFRKPVLPGDQLVFELTAVKIKSKTGLVQGKATVDGQLVAEADLMFALGE